MVMRKKRALFKDIVREVRHTKNRFFSIFAIVAIGCGFFAGVKATCPDMKATAADYFATHNLYDFKVMTNYGLTEENVRALREVEGVRAVMPGYSTDLFAKDGDSSVVVKVYSYDPAFTGDEAMNQPVLLEGRMPEKAGECVVENNYHTPKSFSIGGTICLFADEDSPDLSDTLATDTFTIVGIVESPMYLSIDRGITTIGDGSVNSFLYVNADTFTSKYYTEAYLTMEGTQGVSPYEDTYAGLVDGMDSRLEALMPDMARARYREIVAEAEEEIRDGKEEVADGESELAEARQKLRDAEKELTDGEQAWIDARNEATTTLNNAQKTIDEKQAELDAAQLQIREGQPLLEDGIRQLDNGLATLDTEQAKLDQNRADLTAAQQGRTLLAALRGVLAAPTGALSAEEQSLVQASAALHSSLPALITDARTTGDAGLMAQANGILAAVDASLPTDAEITDGFARLDAGQQTLSATRDGLIQQRTSLKAQLDELLQAKTQLEDGQVQLESARAQLTAAQTDAYRQLDENRQVLLDARKTFEMEKAKADREIADGEAELADARQKLADAEEDLAALSAPQGYVFDRDSDAGYASFAEDAERVDAIAGVFPFFFILVAALVCLTTMTRMVEDQRTQIGTVKALGYSVGDIMMKYLLYAAAASLLGSLAGTAFGLWLFPTVIYNAYTMMYTTPPLIPSFPAIYFIGCAVVSVVCTSAAALAACYRELRSQPAELMRPKAPPAGKRVLLEKIPFLWNRFSFIQKVTVRNLFRYKKRVLLTIVGIAGCTALMLTGFGLKDSIGVIVDKQYGDIFVNDAITLLDSKASPEEVENVRSLIAGDQSVTTVQWAKQAAATAHASGSADIYLVVFEDPQQADEVVKLHERKSGQELWITDDSVVITEKLSKLLNVGVGDSFTLTGTDLPDMTLTVGAITENYAYHYVYITPAVYEKLTGTTPFYNAAFLRFQDPEDEAARTAYAETLLKQDGVLATTFTKDSTKTFQDIITSLNMIVVVLIVSAGALAFVVLYNLTNINVTERIRELATIKVLGFYDPEVAAYVYRENMVCSALGVLLGLGLGVALHRFVVLTAEVDMVMFSRDISAMSFVLAALLTMAFTLVVNFVLYFTLKKIDMVISLKSIE